MARRIEESVFVDAPRALVWRTFADLSCWADWSRVLTRVVPEGEAGLACGSRFSCCLRPLGAAVAFTVHVEEADPPARLLWVAARWGVRGRHWFHFSDHGDGTRCDSVEDLTGPAVALAGPFFPERRFRALTRRFLEDLKAGAERRAGGG